MPVLCPADLALTPKVSKSLVCLLPRRGVLAEEEGNLTLFTQGWRDIQENYRAEEVGTELNWLEKSVKTLIFFVSEVRKGLTIEDGVQAPTSLFGFSSHLSPGAPWLENLRVPSALAFTASGRCYSVLFKSAVFFSGQPCFSLPSSLVMLGAQVAGSEEKRSLISWAWQEVLLSPIKVCVWNVLLFRLHLFSHISL